MKNLKLIILILIIQIPQILTSQHSMKCLTDNYVMNSTGYSMIKDEYYSLTPQHHSSLLVYAQQGLNNPLPPFSPVTSGVNGIRIQSFNHTKDSTNYDYGFKMSSKDFNTGLIWDANQKRNVICGFTEQSTGSYMMYVAHLDQTNGAILNINKYTIIDSVRPAFNNTFPLDIIFLKGSSNSDIQYIVVGYIADNPDSRISLKIPFVACLKSNLQLSWVRFHDEPYPRAHFNSICEDSSLNTILIGGVTGEIIGVGNSSERILLTKIHYLTNTELAMNTFKTVSGQDDPTIGDMYFDPIKNKYYLLSFSLNRESISLTKLNKFTLMPERAVSYNYSFPPNPIGPNSFVLTGFDILDYRKTIDINSSNNLTVVAKAPGYLASGIFLPPPFNYTSIVVEFDKDSLYKQRLVTLINDNNNGFDNFFIDPLFKTFDATNHAPDLWIPKTSYFNHDNSTQGIFTVFHKRDPFISPFKYQRPTIDFLDYLNGQNEDEDCIRFDQEIYDIHIVDTPQIDTTINTITNSIQNSVISEVNLNTIDFFPVGITSPIGCIGSGNKRSNLDLLENKANIYPTLFSKNFFIDNVNYSTIDELSLFNPIGQKIKFNYFLDSNKIEINLLEEYHGVLILKYKNHQTEHNSILISE